MLGRRRQPWSDRRAELTLGALACAVLLVIVLMVIFVANEAWPTFQHNGLRWLFPGGNVDEQIGTMVNAGAKPPASDFHLRAWPLVWGTILSTGMAVFFGLIFALLASIFIVEFAPDRLRAVIVPVVRLLAAVPSVIYGLIGILVLVPFVGNHIVSAHDKKSVEFIVQLSGASLLVAVVILTVMIVPIMIAICVDALYAVPRGWKEGAVALGVNRWRAMWTVSVRAARPAIIAAAVLACARALGEAIMLSMVSGSVGFAPNPFDGPRLFLLEPLRPLASTIVEDSESLQAPAVRSTVYAFALLLLFSSLFLSLAGFLAKQPMKKYGVRISMAVTHPRTLDDLPHGGFGVGPTGGVSGPPRKRPKRDSMADWRWSDRIAYVLCWVAGLSLCLIAALIVGYMAVRGVQYLKPNLLWSHPSGEVDQSASGGFFDPIVGTILLTIIGICIATPIAVGAAIWVVEYGRPSGLARMVESGIEVVAGTPDIVLAIFGLALFQHGLFGWMSFTAEGGAVFGRSFLTAGAMMSLIALPMIFGATREGLQSIPRHVREASYGLGKTKIATIRRVLLPAVRPNISTGAALGMGRIAGDTAIVVILLGATLRLESEGGIPGVDVLKGTGSTLTSYVYNNSPAGEGNAPEKAYAAAFVLLLLVVALNFAVDLIASRGAKTGLEGTRLGAGR